MNIDVTDAFAMEPMPLNVAMNLVGIRNYCQWQVLEQIQSQCAIRQTAAGNFSHHKWVYDYGIAFKQSG